MYLEFFSILCRYGLGLILQAKLQLLAAAPEEESEESRPPRRRSLMRQISTLIFSRRSTRRSRFSSDHARDASLNEISEEPNQEEPLSPMKSSKATRVPLHHKLSRHFTRLFSQSDDPPSKPDPKPRYKTASFHQFVNETFPGSIKLEEHQVAVYVIIRHDF